ncbi:hypothetical protein MLD38_020058 [Melastoma candidum]|uniref:Uncharacterized protein n=1 Tax=Melastoma candidum TaxID=119954 RepID=A0ACB9QBW4_9MYRT|nr:hypothetical protein MLD38_020058 [Melastoma candidum]
MSRNYRLSTHRRLSLKKDSKNLAGLIVAVIGPTSLGKTTLSREIAKSLRATFIEHDLLRSCFPPRDSSASDGDPDPAYQILWKMIKTHLDHRNHNHHIVVDYPLSRRVEIDRLLGIAKPHDAMVILIDCELGQRSEARPHDREGEATLARYLQWSLTMEEERVDDCFYDYDPSKIDVPRLVIGSTSDAGLEEHVAAVKRLILISLDEKFAITEGDGTMTWDFSWHNQDAVRMICFQTRMLQVPGHVPPGSKEGNLRYSQLKAQHIAKGLRCMFLNYDDLLSCLGSPDANADVDDDDAVFNALVQMAASQLSLGQSVAIRAPLPHRAQVDLLLDAANSTQAKLIVLELRKKKQVNKELLSEYDLNDVPKLVLPELNSLGYDEEDDLLDFILMASSMNHWHVGDGTESVLKDVKFRPIYFEPNGFTAPQEGEARRVAPQERNPGRRRGMRNAAKLLSETFPINPTASLAMDLLPGYSFNPKLKWNPEVKDYIVAAYGEARISEADAGVDSWFSFC